MNNYTILPHLIFHRLPFPKPLKKLSMTETVLIKNLYNKPINKYLYFDNNAKFTVRLSLNYKMKRFNIKSRSNNFI